MSTATAIIRTKFRLEPIPAVLVARNRLTARLSRTGVTVTTVVGPAGYGKSTLISEWELTPHARGRRFAALRFDVRDNDPVRFWNHLVAASRALGADLAQATGSLLRDEIRTSPNAVPEASLAAVVEALEAAPQRGILVLDDVHLLTHPGNRDGLGALLAVLPATVHVVLLSRSTIIGLGLHRLRARGRLDDITARELACTRDEAAELIDRLGGTVPPPAELDELVNRTEGWMTGLRYAAAALRESAEPAVLVRTFTGSSRDVTAFLVGEVLDRQSPDRQQFLMAVSILDELTGPACDAVTGRTDATAVLAELEEAGQFVTALDEARDRFRFQPLFREFLQNQLRSRAPDRLHGLHALAAQWYEASGQASPAIEHALLAGDHDRAARLIAPLVADLHRRGLDSTLERWFRSIPDTVLTAVPQLALKQAWISVYAGDPASAITWSQRADAANTADVGPPGFVDPDVTVESACVRAVAYRTLGDLSAALSWGGAAVLQLDERERTHRYHDSYARLEMTDAMAEAHALSGAPELGIALLQQNLDRTRDGANVFAAVSLPGKLAALASMVGRLDEVTKNVDRAMAEAERFGLTTSSPAADAHVAIGELRWERDDLEPSAAAFSAAIDTATTTGRIWIHARALLGLAKCRSAQRQFGEATAVLQTAGRIYPWGPPPDFFRAQLTECRLLTAVRRGDPVEARRRFTELAVLPIAAHRLGYLDIVVTLAEGRLDALAHLDRVAPPGAVDHHPRWALEWAVLDLRIASALGEADVLPAFLRALRLGQSGGFVRTVIGPDAALVSTCLRALRSADRGPLAPEYIRLIDAAARRELGKTDDVPTPRGREGTGESFSAGELAVLEFLPSDLTYAEIASRRYVSVNTVKSQLKSLYRKLGVTTRAGAAERGRRLGLLR